METHSAQRNGSNSSSNSNNSNNSGDTSKPATAAKSGSGGSGGGGNRGSSKKKSQAAKSQKNTATNATTPASASASASTTNTTAATTTAIDASNDGVSDDEHEVCVICTEPLKIVAVPPCNHHMCYLCNLRLRSLYKSNECPYCKVESTNVIYAEYDAVQAAESEAESKDDGSVSGYDILKAKMDSLPKSKLAEMHDNKLGIDFYDKQSKDKAEYALFFNCPFSGCKEGGFDGWASVRKHAYDTHGLLMCDLCVKHKKVFVHEHHLYSHAQFRHHMKGGAKIYGDRRDGFKGHPECGFCSTRFYDSDALYAHCREKHEECHICRNLGKHNIYYKDRKGLEEHFALEHYTCKHPKCKEQRLVVFANELDLMAHEMEEHPNTTIGGQQRSAINRSRQIQLTSTTGVSAPSGFGRLRISELEPAAAAAATTTTTSSAAAVPSGPVVPDLVNDFPTLGGSSSSSGGISNATNYARHAVGTHGARGRLDASQFPTLSSSSSSSQSNWASSRNQPSKPQVGFGYGKSTQRSFAQQPRSAQSASSSGFPALSNKPDQQQQQQQQSSQSRTAANIASSPARNIPPHIREAQRQLMDRLNTYFSGDDSLVGEFQTVTETLRGGGAATATPQAAATYIDTLWKLFTRVSPSAATIADKNRNPRHVLNQTVKSVINLMLLDETDGTLEEDLRVKRRIDELRKALTSYSAKPPVLAPAVSSARNSPSGSPLGSPAIRPAAVSSSSSSGFPSLQPMRPPSQPSSASSDSVVAAPKVLVVKAGTTGAGSALNSRGDRRPAVILPQQFIQPSQLQPSRVSRSNSAEGGGFPTLSSSTATAASASAAKPSSGSSGSAWGSESSGPKATGSSRDKLRTGATMSLNDFNRL